jgi:hypothetical protein
LGKISFNLVTLVFHHICSLMLSDLFEWMKTFSTQKIYGLESSTCAPANSSSSECFRIRTKSGSNPLTVNYNASAVRTRNISRILFYQKHFLGQNALAFYNAGVVFIYVVVNSEVLGVSPSKPDLR